MSDLQKTTKQDHSYLFASNSKNFPTFSQRHKLLSIPRSAFPWCEYIRVAQKNIDVYGTR